MPSRCGCHRPGRSALPSSPWGGPRRRCACETTAEVENRFAGARNKNAQTDGGIVRNKPKPLVDEKPTVVQKRWWEIASDLTTKADGLTKALAALLSAAILAWGLIASRSSPT